MRRQRSTGLVWGLAIATLVGVSVVRLAWGESGWGFATSEYVFGLRLASLTAGCVVGAVLALAGVTLQALLRNPLAEPYILGLSTGAAAGVMAQTALFYWIGWVIGPAYWGAGIGSLLSLLLVVAVSRRNGVVDPLGLLLTGVVLSTIGGALMMLFNAVAGPGGLRDDLIAWMMGQLRQGDGVWPVRVVAMVGTLCWSRLMLLGPAMDKASLSADEASSLGVRVGQLRIELLLIGSLLAAGAVVLAGPVAFVGLVAPHVARLVLGPRHQGLVAISPVLGATLVVGAHVAGDMVGGMLAVGQLPLGVFTALIGGPVFLMLLRVRLGRGGV